MLKSSASAEKWRNRNLRTRSESGNEKVSLTSVLKLIFLSSLLNYDGEITTAWSSRTLSLFLKQREAHLGLPCDATLKLRDQVSDADREVQELRQQLLESQKMIEQM